MKKNETDLTLTQQRIKEVCDNMAAFLIEKNRRYGNSALEPMKVFSKVDAANSILIRLDDKLNRIKNSDELRKNDCSDMLGYLLLYCVANKWLDFNELLD